MLEQKILQVHHKANTPFHFTQTKRDVTSIKLSPEHRDFLEKMVNTGDFQSRSEAIRYCIQFYKDLDVVIDSLVEGVSIKIFEKLRRNYR